jgi:hypothetical protein
MQPEENSVELVLVDGGDDRITEPVKCRPPYFAAWSRSSTEYMTDMPVMRSSGVEESSKCRIRLAPLCDRFCAHQDITAQEGLFVSFLKTEGIGFMRDFGSQDVETNCVIP